MMACLLLAVRLTAFFGCRTKFLQLSELEAVLVCRNGIAALPTYKP